jgi:hypothetical protein
MEVDFILYLKHYSIGLESFLRANQEEFIIDGFYKKQKMMNVSKDKIETELKIVKSIINSYEKFRKTN